MWLFPIAIYLMKKSLREKDKLGLIENVLFELDVICHFI